ncbi:MAG TPA: hypothetical protein DCS21_05060, partial [Gammaproteobacteria bacterium]|nr:hypothetical protein [Gammaproteobacteria bacterium]
FTVPRDWAAAAFTSTTRSRFNSISVIKIPG